MSSPVEVIAYSGYRGEQEPRAVVIDGQRLEVRQVHRRWRSPDGRYFEVEVAGERRVALRCRAEDGLWSLFES